MEDLQNDIANCEAEKISEIPKLKSLKENWDMIYRTVRKESDEKHFIISTLGQKAPQIDDTSELASIDSFDIRKTRPSGISTTKANTNDKGFEKIKINLFETNSGIQEVFMFQPSDILSSDEIKLLQRKPQQSN